MVDRDFVEQLKMAGATGSSSDMAELKALDTKINTLLPSQYHYCYEDVKPVSMGSAGLKYGPDGRVAWDDIWTAFCHLALAGGPPHRGTLLEPVAPEVALEQPEEYQQVVEEIGRGLWLVTSLPVLPRLMPGWVGLRCDDETMAAWLMRAIVVENVMACHDQTMLLLPAGPHFTLEKEIKNIVTVVAKTCHYWTGHMPTEQQASISAIMNRTKLLQPSSPSEVRAAPSEHHRVGEAITRGIQQATSLPSVSSRYLGWVGVECTDLEMAVWLLRAVIVENILVRREGNVLYLPTSPRFSDEACHRIVHSVAGAWRLWHKRFHDERW